MRNNKGFSLVELIVVIAIMAILASVAVVGVSFYIPKAQKAVDQQSVNDVIDAFTLYYYSNPEGVTGGYVVLGSEGVVETDAAGFGAAAMEATFGANWQTAIKLQYKDWQGVSSTENYKDSSYSGKESELIGIVDGLTDALGTTVTGNQALAESLLGGNFGAFLEEYEISIEDSEGVGNAAVLYVAQTTKANKDKFEGAFSSGIASGTNKVTDRLVNGEIDINSDSGRETAANTVLNEVYYELKAQGVGDAAAMAAVYAYAEGYAQQYGKTETFHNNVNFDNDDDPAKVIATISRGMSGMFDVNEFNEYSSADGKGVTNLRSYIEAMETVDAYKGVVSDKLTNSDCFTDGVVSDMLKDYAAMSKFNVSTEDGQVAIVFTVDEDGNPVAHIAPLNWDK